MPDEPAAPEPPVRPPRKKRRWRRLIAIGALALWVATGWWHADKPLPPGLHAGGEPQLVPADSLQLLVDVSWADAQGERLSRQQILPATLELIAGARDFLVLEYFLFGEQGVELADVPAAAAGASGRLRAQLLELRRAQPQLPILLLVDPINSSYSARLPPDLRELSAAGIDVVLVDLDPLRDSNPAWSAFWRLAIRWWTPWRASADDRAALPNPLDTDGERMSFGGWARLLNFKADHRKLAITVGEGGSLVGIVSSANPHDASGAHSNLGLRLSGPALQPLLDTVVAVARMSGWSGAAPHVAGTRDAPAAAPGPAASVAIATEGAIRESLLGRLDRTQRGDAVDLAMFYLTDRGVIRSLLAASRRGVAVRVLLDPNKDAFGRQKSGLPNRQVASELVAASDGHIRVRWYRTHGEQFHAKVVAVREREMLWLCLGSANLTRRNLGDLNLEANVIVQLPRTTVLAGEVTSWFETLWSNRGPAGVEYTAGVDVYVDPSQGRYWGYRIMEATGLSTF